MKNIVKIIFPAMLMLFGVLLIAFSGCEKDHVKKWEIFPDSGQTAIETTIEGISFKFCLLNEQGEPATVFKEDENFTFYFQIKNETGKNYYYNGYECIYNDNFLSISDSSGKTIGKSYEALPQTDIGMAAYPFNDSDSYTFKIPWTHSEEAIFQGGDSMYKSILRVPLVAGNYSTSFSHKFKLYGVAGNDNLETEDLLFIINFKVQ